MSRRDLSTFLGHCDTKQRDREIAARNCTLIHKSVIHREGRCDDVFEGYFIHRPPVDGRGFTRPTLK